MSRNLYESEIFAVTEFMGPDRQVGQVSSDPLRLIQLTRFDPWEMYFSITRSEFLRAFRSIFHNLSLEEQRGITGRTETG